MLTEEQSNDVRLRAANAYLVWPLAALDLFREREGASAWSRLHTRQAFVFGILAVVGYFVLLALPLVIVVIFSGVSTGGTVWVYGIGALADVIGAVWLFAVALAFRERTLRGELFAVPLATRIADRFFRLRD